MANQTVLIGKMDCKTATKAAIELKIGRPLSNPINTKKEGEDFEATLTGEIAITAFGKRKSRAFPVWRSCAEYHRSTIMN